jgi:WD40 repeat protein
MSRFVILLLVAGPSVASDQPAVAEQPPAGTHKAGIPNKAIRTDCYGDPLPRGAIARLGTVRFRHGDRIECLAFSPSSAILASGSWDHSVRLWDTTSAREIRRLTGHGGPLACLAFSHDGRVLASASFDDATFRLWDVSTGQEIRRCQGRRVARCLAFSPDDRLLASAEEEKTAGLWVTATGAELRRFPSQGETSRVAFSPDGRTLAAGSRDGILHLWDVASGREVRRLEGHAGPVALLAFTPDRPALVSGTPSCRSGAGDAWEVKVWDLATGQEERRLGGMKGHQPLCLALSPGARTLAVRGPRALLQFWDLATGKELRQTQVDRSRTLALAFSADGRTLASGGWDPGLAWLPLKGGAGVLALCQASGWVL